MEFGSNELYYLDLKLILVHNKLQTTMWIKPTENHLHLQVDSWHHSPSVNGIQKGVTLRLHRICSTDEQCIKKSK